MAPKWKKKDSDIYSTLLQHVVKKGFVPKNGNILPKSNDIIKLAVNALPNTADSCMFPGRDGEILLYGV